MLDANAIVPSKGTRILVKSVDFMKFITSSFENTLMSGYKGHPLGRGVENGSILEDESADDGDE